MKISQGSGNFKTSQCVSGPARQ